VSSWCVAFRESARTVFQRQALRIDQVADHLRACQAAGEMNGEALVSARNALQDPSTVNDKRP
jgi:hypothetical protein